MEVGFFEQTLPDNIGCKKNICTEHLNEKISFLKKYPHQYNIDKELDIPFVCLLFLPIKPALR